MRSNNTIKIKALKRAIREIKAKIKEDLGLHSLPPIIIRPVENMTQLAHYDPIADCIVIFDHLDPSWIPETLAHECRHVYQFKKGWLRFNAGGANWKGEQLSNKFIDDPEMYTKLPWEIDAVDYSVKFIIEYFGTK